MIRDRLAKLPPDRLKRISDKLGVPFAEGEISQDFLASLEEAVEDYVRERQVLASDLTQSAPKKFYMYAEEQQIIDLLETHSYDNASTQTRLVSVLRDPSWSYIYWDISADHLNALGYVAEKDELGLRIIYDQGNFDEGAEFFDILLDNHHGDRYLSLPVSNATYWLELFLRKGMNRRVTLARTGELRIPQSEISLANKKKKSSYLANCPRIPRG